MRDLKGRVAFITGGASGIGFGMAEAFAAAGMRLVIADIDPAALARAEDTLRSAGADVHMSTLDVTSAAAWETAITQAEAAFGGIDVLCNNAGVGQGRLASGAAITLADMTESLWRLVLETNVTGAFLGVRAAVPRMIAHGRGGHIVNTASMAGLLAPPGLGAYCASKFALMGMSEALRAELAPLGIGVSILCPGAVNSNLVPNSIARLAAADTDVTRDMATQRGGNPVRMDARRVGERVLRAIGDNELYIITHPEYRPLAEERMTAVLAAFGNSAEPGYADPPELLARSRSPIYAPPIYAPDKEPHHG